MKFHPNELFIYLNPQTGTGKQCKAYAKSISNNVNEVDCNKVKLTTTLWKDLINMLGLRPKDLLDRSHHEYQEKIAGNTFTMTGWLEILVNNPHLIKAPIVVYNNKAILCNKPTDILQLNLSKKESSNIPPHLRNKDQ